MKKSILLLSALIFSIFHIAAVELSNIKYEVVNPPQNEWVAGVYNIKLLTTGDITANRICFVKTGKNLTFLYSCNGTTIFKPKAGLASVIIIKFKNGNIASAIIEPPYSENSKNHIEIGLNSFFNTDGENIPFETILKLLVDYDIEKWFFTYDVLSLTENDFIDIESSTTLTSLLPTQNSKVIFRKLLSEMQRLAGDNLKDVSPIISQALGTTYKPSTSQATQQQTKRPTTTTVASQQKTNSTSTPQTTQGSTNLKYLSDVKVNTETIDNNKYWGIRIAPKNGKYFSYIVKIVSDSGKQLKYYGPKVRVKMLNWKEGADLMVKGNAYGKNDNSFDYIILPAEKKYIQSSGNSAKVVVEVYDFPNGNELLETYETPLYKLAD